MRDIKFRSWNKVSKTMYGNSIYNCKDSFDMQLKHPQIYEVMQYIGLEDKNGRKIYEGDIIRYSDIEISNTDCGIEYNDIINIGEVLYDNESAYYYVTNTYSVEMDEVWEDAEVIGNIYENPELLERE